jgi:hypothetical protein
MDMEKALFDKVFEILTRLEEKIDAVDDRTERIEERLDDQEYARKFGVIR